jgi:hypothetical protein
MMRRYWEEGRKVKITPPTPAPKGKNRAHLECVLGFPIGCIKFLFPKLFITIFGLG